VPRGRFITFEGIEGSGKSTQAERLAEALRARNVPVVTAREPGGTPLGERLRDVLLDPSADPVALAELFLLEAARAQLVQRVLVPALEQGATVICDRFADSSRAYQGVARGLGIEAVATLNTLASGGVWPDRTVVLDLPVHLALSRARARPSTVASNRRFEDEVEAFHVTVSRAFRELAAAEPARVALVDASGTPDEVHARVLSALEGSLP
jgi:dTMP kinase